MILLYIAHEKASGREEDDSFRRAVIPQDFPGRLARPPERECLDGGHGGSIAARCLHEDLRQCIANQ